MNTKKQLNTTTDQKLNNMFGDFDKALQELNDFTTKQIEVIDTIQDKRARMGKKF